MTLPEPKQLLTWAVIAAVAIFFLKYILPIFAVVLIGGFGLLLVLFLLDAIYGGSAAEQFAQIVSDWIKANF